MPTSSLKTLLVLGGILMIAALGVAGYLYLSSKESKTSTATVSLTATADTPFTDLNGNVVDLTEYANKIRVVNSWASWSPLSQDELPLLNEVAASYKERGIIFLAINRKETKEYAGGYLATLPSLDNLKIIFDPADTFFSKVEGYAMPETIVFDTDGNIHTHIRGTIKKDELIAVLDALIEAGN